MTKDPNLIIFGGVGGREGGGGGRGGGVASVSEFF